MGASATGFTGVLHTWGRDLSYHPHVHFLVPAGGLDKEGRWVNSRASVFVPEQVLAYRFRVLMQQRLQDASGFDSVAASVWRRRWVVDSTGVGDGQRAMAYLAPYVARGARGNWRVTQCDDRACLDEAQLVLQVKRSGTKSYRGMRLSVVEFIRRWLLHVLPAGLHRVRHYGLLHPASRYGIEQLKLIVAAATMRLYLLACTEIIVMAEQPGGMRCQRCGSAMVSLGYTPPITVAADLAASLPSGSRVTIGRCSLDSLERAPP